jgi:serine/threonine protein kinase
MQGKLVGQGSFGSVYLGIDLHTGKEVRSCSSSGLQDKQNKQQQEL